MGVNFELLSRFYSHMQSNHAADLLSPIRSPLPSGRGPVIMEQWAVTLEKEGGSVGLTNLKHVDRS